MWLKSFVKSILPNNLYVLLWHAKQKIIYKRWPKNKAWNGSGKVLNVCIAYNSFGGYCVPLSSRHRGAAQTILHARTYEPDTIAYISQATGAGDIVHAGTYFGDFLPHLSNIVGDQGIVWAFEPNRENYRCAAITCLLNGSTNIRLHNQALGSARQRMRLQIEAEDGQPLGGSSKITLSSSEDKRHQIVETVPIDEIVPADRHVSLIHLDIEGYEEQALRGALNTIRRCKPILILETTPSQKWFEKNLATLGYRVATKAHVNTIYTC